MIRRELPLTTDASPAKPVANFRRGFSFVLAPAAADLVLELNWLVQGFCFFPSWKGFCFCLSCSHWLLESLLGLDGNRPDKAQQFSSDFGHDLPLILACHGQRLVALVQAILRFPCDFYDLCRNPLLSLTQLGPDSGPVSIAPSRFHHDASEVRVTGLGNGASSNAVATGVFVGKYAA